MCMIEVANKEIPLFTHYLIKRSRDKSIRKHFLAMNDLEEGIHCFQI